MLILIGSKNKAKIEGAKLAFLEYFNNVEVVGENVESNVSSEPIDLDIYNGAKNRVKNIITYAKLNKINADYYLGIESGLTNLLGKWVIINVAVIINKFGEESWGVSPGFPVPNKYVENIKKYDLGMVMNDIFNSNNLRVEKGGVYFLTKGKVNRIELTKSAFTMALTQFINKDVWSDFK